MPTRAPTLLALAALLTAGCAAAPGPTAAPAPAGPQSARPAPAPLGKGVKAFREGPKTAYMTADALVLHKPEAGQRWLLGATFYQNDLTDHGRPDPAKPVLLMMSFKGRPDIFSPANDSLKLVMALGGGPGVYCPIQWQAGPDDSFDGTTATFAAVLSPAAVRRLLAPIDGPAIGAVVDASKPEGGKAWAKLAVFDLRQTGAIDALRAFLDG